MNTQPRYVFEISHWEASPLSGLRRLPLRGLPCALQATPHFSLSIQFLNQE